MPHRRKRPVVRSTRGTRVSIAFVFPGRVPPKWLNDPSEHRTVDSNRSSSVGLTRSFVAKTCYTRLVLSHFRGRRRRTAYARDVVGRGRREARFG